MPDPPVHRVRLFHRNAAEAEERAGQLRAAGYAVEHEPFRGGASLRALRGEPPAAVVIDLTRVPSQGRDVGVAIRYYKETRAVPLVFERSAVSHQLSAFSRFGLTADKLTADG